MAHYRILFIGNPDNLYNEENGLFDMYDENDNQISSGYDYGSPVEGLMVNGHLVETAISKNIDWEKSYSISAVYREDEKKRILRK